jgi:cytoskeleton protein RodZ
MNEPQANNVSEMKNGPGASLRVMREARNISLDEMAKQLRLSSQRLSQIERDDYKNIGAGAYALGYLRSYARALGLSDNGVQEILNSFETSGLETEILSNRPQLINEKISQRNPKFVRRLGYLVLLGAVILVGFWWYSHNNESMRKSHVETTSP